MDSISHNCVEHGKIKNRNGEIMIQYTSVSDIGLLRKENQDDLSIIEHDGALLAFICDGIGGSKGGSVASSMSVDLMSKDFLQQEPFTDLKDVEKWFDKAVRKTNELVFRASLKDMKYQGMGTTLVAVVISPVGSIGFNIGDSRLYTYENEDLVSLSQDQTFAYEMYLRNEIDYHELETHPKRNILMNAIGIDSNISYQTITMDESWQSLLLCSDGLHGYVSHEGMSASFKHKDIVERRNDLLTQALDSGGYDNISIILIERNDL